MVQYSKSFEQDSSKIIPSPWGLHCPLRVNTCSPNHEHSIDQLNKLKIPKCIIKTLMKIIHQNVIKYFTYLVLNERKLDNKQTPVLPP